MLEFTWQEFDKAVSKLEKETKHLVPFIKNIYGLPRGGLILAVALSHRINKPILFDKSKISKNTLVVDDISDTGKQLKILLKDKEYLRTITLCINKNTKFIPSYYSLKINQWIRFPWETKKSTKIK